LLVSKGEGLGNAFLSNIRAVDGIFNVLRIFEDSDVTHVEGSIDPVRDLDIIAEELILKDLDMVTKYKEKLEKELSHQKDKKKLADKEIVIKCEQVLTEKKQIRFVDWKATEMEFLNSLQLLTAKNVVYLINMSEKDYIKKGNKLLPKF